jgi:hypothetical protein
MECYGSSLHQRSARISIRFNRYLPLVIGGLFIGTIGRFQWNNTRHQFRQPGLTNAEGLASLASANPAALADFKQSVNSNQRKKKDRCRNDYLKQAHTRPNL